MERLYDGSKAEAQKCCKGPLPAAAAATHQSKEKPDRSLTAIFFDTLERIPVACLGVIRASGR